MWRGQGIPGRGYGKAPSAGKASRRGFPPASLGHGKCGVRAPPRALAAMPLVRRIGVAAAAGEYRHPGTGTTSRHRAGIGARVLVWIRDAALQHAGRALPASARGSAPERRPGLETRDSSARAGRPWQWESGGHAAAACKGWRNALAGFQVYASGHQVYRQRTVKAPLPSGRFVSSRCFPEG